MKMASVLEGALRYGAQPEPIPDQAGLTGLEFRVYAVRVWRSASRDKDDTQPPEPPEGGTPSLHPWLVPAYAIIPNQIIPPDSLRLLEARLRQILRRAAPPPIRPSFDIAVSHRVVMNII